MVLGCNPATPTFFSFIFSINFLYYCIMKKLLLLLLCLPLIGFSQDKSKEIIIDVSNANEFVDAIGSNRIIRLISDIDLSRIDTNKFGNYYVVQDCHIGHELVIRNVSNMSIVGVSIGSSKEDTMTSIITPFTYANVLMFESCNNVRILSINAGHWPEESVCGGGVFYFKNCDNIIIENSRMYGSGIQGIQAKNVSYLKCNNSIIDGCSYNIMSLLNVNNCRFYNCKFYNNEAWFQLIQIHKSHKIVFEKCIISDNKMMYNNREGCKDDYWKFMGFFGITESKLISMQDCYIKDNQMCHFVKEEGIIYWDDETKFEDNIWWISPFKFIN